MSPTDKNDGTASSNSKQEKINFDQGKMKQGKPDQSPATEPAIVSDMKSREPETADVKIPEHGTVTNIPFFTAKSSTLKCSDNDQMKMFDPGECSNNEVVMSNQNGCQVKFPNKNCNSVTKNKNYKAGSKINKLADMLAKRSQNIVEMTQNVTSDVIADIISAPKVEGKIDKVEISDIGRNEEKLGLSGVFCEKTVSNQPMDCVKNQNKSVPNDNSVNVKELQSQLSHNCSDASEISGISSQETAVSGNNALKEHLTKLETDASTKIKKDIRKNLKNIELSLILPEKKRRSSPRNKLVNSDVNKECIESFEGGKSSAKAIKADRNAISHPLNEEGKSFVKVNSVKKTEKSKSGRQRKSKRLVETSTQTATTDFVSVEAAKSESVPRAEAVLPPSVNLEAEEPKQFCLGKPVFPGTGEKSDSAPEQEFEESQKTGSKLTVGENSDSKHGKISGETLELTEDLDSTLKSECEENSDVTPATENANIDKCVYACAYCKASFVSKAECKDHEKSHSSKKNKHITKCQFCNKQYQSLNDLKLHCIKNHPSKFAYCAKCDERYCKKSQLRCHNKLFHLTKATETAQNLTKIQESSEMNLREKHKDDAEEAKKSADKKTGNKSSSVKSDLKVDVSFETTKKSSTSPRAGQKVSPRENKTEEQLLEMEMLFYSHLSGNIKENLTNHLDGKIDKNGNPIQTDVLNDSSENSQKVKSTILLSVVTANSSAAPDQVSRAPSPYQTRSKTPNPLPPTAKKFKKLPNWQQKFWEKYNFPTSYRYDHRFWDKNYFSAEKSAIYLKDLSCLDIKTQLIMRENIKKLDSIKANEESNKPKELTFPEYLCLVPKINDGNSTRCGGEPSNSDYVTEKNPTDKDERKLRSAAVELNKSRRKNSTDNSTKKRDVEKNSSKNTDCIKMMTRRQSVIELSKGSKKNEEIIKRRKGSLDATETQKMILRRQTSLDNLQRICLENNNKPEKGNSDGAYELNLNENDSEDSLSSSCAGLAEISGEWVRPRSYLCGTCCAKFTNLWELEDHKWVSHPNVWCTHYEFEDEKIDKLFHRSDTENAEEGGSSENTSPASKLKLTDLYKRYLLPHGSLKTAKLVPNMSFPEQCTKCKKNCMSLSEMHKHMLDCGGDTTWFLTMYSSPMTIKRKWRPFGSRRRKQIGRRVIKRNIPNSSNIRPYHYQHRIRTKPGDVESIQKMLANLPEKRARRAINFDEIKTRSQATIHSNRLLRKRFKVSFGTNMMRLKALKQQRQVKSVKKESISTTDTSSENTPTGSPKRKNKQRENVQTSKEENINLDPVQESGEEEPKKKFLKKKTRKENAPKPDVGKRSLKKEQITVDTKKKKPPARSSSCGSIDANRESFNKKKKGQLETSETVAAPDPLEEVRVDEKDKKNKQKTLKKKRVQKIILEKPVNKELTDNDAESSQVKSDREIFTKKKTKTEIEEEIVVKVEPTLVPPDDGECTKGKKGKLPEKNILRLKSNDKEKTELIKRIRKTLKNSKKILKKRESKGKKERRRSLRIKTLQLTDANLQICEKTFNIEKNLKDPEEVNIPDTKGSPTLNFERDTTSSFKKASKMLKNLKATDLKCSSGDSLSDDTNGVRRSSRSTMVPLIGEKIEAPGSESSNNLKEDVKKEEFLHKGSSEASHSELPVTMRVSENTHGLKILEDNSDPNVGFEFELTRKGHYNSKSKRDSGLEPQPGTSCQNQETPKNPAQSFTERSAESGSYDLAEMPVLDKEEPIRGRTTRKSETEIPILMPFENEEKIVKNSKDPRGGKRKGLVTFRVVNKRRKSTEKLNPLTIVKETAIVSEKEKEPPQSGMKNEEHSGEFNRKKRKRNQGFKDCEGSQQKLPKTPKAKKYFLGICPNEIDKGGDSKDESGSDSEPLISLIMNQKIKEKAKMSPDLKAESTMLHTDENETVGQKNEENLEYDVKETGRKSEKEVKQTLDAAYDEEKKQFCVENKLDSNSLQAGIRFPSYISDSSICKMKINAPPPHEYELKKQVPMKKTLKGLKMTVKLKESKPKIIDTPAISPTENQTKVPDDGLLEKDKNFEEPSNIVPEVSQAKTERRSRRISKEIKSTNEFIIDDPLILVDELWSDLDSDSDNAKKRSKKNKKKFTKRKSYEDKKENSVNLEELLRNFGERKVTKPEKEPKPAASEHSKRKRKITTHLDKRRNLENIFKCGGKSYRRLSLRLFKFNRRAENFGTLGLRLLSMKKNAADVSDKDFKALPTLPFLAAEVKENPVQIIQCGVQRAKPVKKNNRKAETEFDCNMQLKISLPLQNINNLAVLNNNHLSEVVEEVATQVSNLCSVEEVPDPTQREDENLKTSLKLDVEPTYINSKDEDASEAEDLKLKPRRSEMIDKIFYCEICQTYYYSPSQLKIHKSSNRHKVKELELSGNQDKPTEALPVPEDVHQDKPIEALSVPEDVHQDKPIEALSVPEGVHQDKPIEALSVPEDMHQDKPIEALSVLEDVHQDKPAVEPDLEIVHEELDKSANNVPTENLDLEKLNDDTSEMPILEGPFIENPFVRLGTVMPPSKPPPSTSNVFGFTEDCLKDIQKAIGCTDEEMLILSLLGENSIEIENDILDLDSCQPVAPSPTTAKTEDTGEIRERENSNGLFKMDFKKRITSALARLVNKAVLNLLQKYKNTNRTGISPEALSFLIKLSKVNNKKNLLELNELLKNESEGESSTRIFTNDDDKDVTNSYKCLCTVCGTRFQNESVREWHIIRFHRPQANTNFEETSSDPVSVNDGEKEEEVPYSYLCTICGARFQKESTKEIHVIRAHGSKVLKTVEEQSSNPVFIKDDDKKDQNIPYKYLCTICGSRFQKESMWECHIKRSHKSKGKKNVEEISLAQTGYEDDWSNTWTYDINDELPGNVEAPQFLCSDCGINFMTPQEVLEHQKLEHTVQKDIDLSENGPLQSSTIGSSDEIIKGKRGTRRGPKHLSKAELDQQRIIANNELRKLDRKFSTKNKTNKPKWGIDALKFTVEKENKIIPESAEKEIPLLEPPKSQFEPKNVDIIPKLNLTRTNNIPEFKVVQKTSCLNRFQRILDNKMKRKSSRNDVKDTEEKDSTEKEFVEPITVVRRERKRKSNRYASKKDNGSKVVDIYDFNDSEPEPEPVAFSHVKKGGAVQSHTKLKLIKVKNSNETSKNKPDSTTKDLETEDYDSEDSLPLSLVKRTKTEEEEGEIRGEDQVDKPEGILQQVEYLIEQLENETNQPKSNEEEKNFEKLGCIAGGDSEEKKEENNLEPEYITEEVSVDSQPETFRVSLESKFLQLESIAMKKKNPDLGEIVYESQESLTLDNKIDVITNQKLENILPVADSSQGISDEEDSLPLVLISRKNDAISFDAEFSQTSKKDLETPRELSFETRNICEEEEEEEKTPSENGLDSPKNSLDSLSTFSRNESHLIGDKCEKSFETLNGNVIYRRNDSMSGFDTEMSDYEPLETEKRDSEPEAGESLIKEVMEKEDVVIVCSKKEQDVSKKIRRKQREAPKKKKQTPESVHRKKKILPLLSVTLEENSFRKSESPKLNKDVIMKKIWSRKRYVEDHPDDSENSLTSRDNDFVSEKLLNDDSHSEIDKEIIMKKIWNKKRLEHENENGDILGAKPEDIKINQTEISDEVVIKCGPKAKATPKRKKSRSSTKETSKERIMRKIWSGKCAFQTKAALKTYDSDIIQSSKESDAFEEQHRVKKRGRPPNFLNSKKTKILSDEEKTDEDDLDSLLEEIEREEVEKAIRLEFLQLRRSDKANVEVAKESGNMTVGLFAETCNKQGRELSDRKRKRIRKNVKHPGKNLLKKRKFIKKPNVKSVQQQPPQQLQEAEDDSTGGVIGFVEGRLKNDGETSELALGTTRISYDSESKIKNRKHKKHRHKHHHHKHKHKKSKHRKYVIRKHKMKHKSNECLKDKSDEFENFSILEKMCQDIPNQIDSQSQKRFSTELDSLDSKLDEILMSTSSPFDGKAKECDDTFYEGRRIETERNYGMDSNNIYEFVDDDSGFLCESKGRSKN